MISVMDKLISIIIPIYNHARALKKCVSSIITQTRRPLEVIMVNDGSVDDSGAIAEQMKNLLIKENISAVVLRQENKGAAAARNRGFKEAKGEYVIFWDADTVAKSDMLEKMVKSLEEHPEASYAYCQFKFGWKTMKSHNFDPDLLKKINYIDTTSLIQKNNFIGFDESLNRFQDWDMWLSISEQNKTGVFIPEVLYAKIVHCRKGISSWLPSFLYKMPWQTKKIKEYEKAKNIIFAKHNL